MGSVRRFTTTEAIAHSVCDRFQLPPIPAIGDIPERLPGAVFSPAEARQMLAVCDLADRFFARITAPKGGAQ